MGSQLTGTECELYSLSTPNRQWFAFLANFQEMICFASANELPDGWLGVWKEWVSEYVDG